MRHYENFNLKFLSCDSKGCDLIFEPGKQNDECGWRKIGVTKDNMGRFELHLCPKHSYKEESLLIQLKHIVDIIES